MGAHACAGTEITFVVRCKPKMLYITIWVPQMAAIQSAYNTQLEMSFNGNKLMAADQTDCFGSTQAHTESTVLLKREDVLAK